MTIGEMGGDVHFDAPNPRPYLAPQAPGEPRGKTNLPRALLRKEGFYPPEGSPGSASISMRVSGARRRTL